MKIRRDDLHVLTGSYALDAVSDTEREEFERHLRHCPLCTAEVRGLRETAARLAMTRAVPPPARMEQQVLAATHRTRQLPPLPPEHRARPQRLFAARPLPRAVAARPLARAVPARPVARLFPARPLPRRAAAIAATASMTAAVALGVAQLASTHQPDQAAIARVVRASDARVESTGASGGRVTVVVSAELREAVVSATGMASLPAGRVYQVWVMGPSGARSAGLLQGQLLASGLRPADRIGITVEPAGGTSRPTSLPVAVLPA